MTGNVPGEENDQVRGPFGQYSYSGSGWDRDIESRRSTGGHAILFRGCFVGWRSSKQICVAAASTEPEYIDRSECIE